MSSQQLMQMDYMGLNGDTRKGENTYDIEGNKDYELPHPFYFLNANQRFIKSVYENPVTVTCLAWEHVSIFFTASSSTTLTAFKIV